LGAMPMTKPPAEYIADLGKQRDEAYQTNAKNVRVLESIKKERDDAREQIAALTAERDNLAQYRCDALNLLNEKAAQLDDARASLATAVPYRQYAELDGAYQRAITERDALKVSLEEKDDQLGSLEVAFVDLKADLARLRTVPANGTYQQHAIALEARNDVLTQENQNLSQEVQRLRTELHDTLNALQVERWGKHAVAVNAAAGQEEA